jgi:hypothetical protein
MARIIKPTWTNRGPSGHKVKHVAYGFTVQLDGKRERRMSAAWADREAAEQGLADFLKARAEETLAADRLAAPPVLTFNAAVERYLKAKDRKRSIAGDRLITRRLEAHFGADAPLDSLTGDAIAS